MNGEMVVYRGTESARRGLALFAVVVMSVLLVGLPAEASRAVTVSAEQAHAQDLLTRARKRAGVPALSVCTDLTEVAQAWSRTMAQGGSLGHNPRAREQIAGWWAWGENVGVGGSVDVVHEALLQSSGHRQNMLSTSFLHVGVGVAEQGGRIWVTQVFRTPKDGQPCVPPSMAHAALTDGVAPVAGVDRYAA